MTSGVEFIACTDFLQFVSDTGSKVVQMLTLMTNVSHRVWKIPVMLGLHFMTAIEFEILHYFRSL